MASLEEIYNKIQEKKEKKEQEMLEEINYKMQSLRFINENRNNFSIRTPGNSGDNKKETDIQIGVATIGNSNLIT